MTDTNNGWPDKPGVPLNPERHGWHWLAWKTEYSDWGNKLCEWFACGWELPDDMTNAQVGQHARYLGPVLTPDEAAELQARIAELEAALLNLIEHTLDCELELDKFHGLGNDAGAGMSSVLCEARAALEGGKK